MSDLPEAFQVMTRKAKKQHKCCECHQQINIGDEYEYSSGIWGGEPHSFKTCKTCAAIREEYRAETNEDVCFGELRNHISETFCRDFGPKEYAEQSGFTLEQIMVFFPDYYDDELEDDAA